MSPSRSRRQVVPHRRSRADILKAIAAGVIIAGSTSLFIWLMRPGPVGVPATGGLLNRQPRSSWLVGTALGSAALSIWWVLRVSRRGRQRAKVLIPLALGVTLVATVVAGFLWPGGLLRHDVAPRPIPTTTTGPTSSTTAAKTGTTLAGATTVPGATTIPGATSVTTVPTSATTPPTSTPTTRSP